MGAIDALVIRWIERETPGVEQEVDTGLLVKLYAHSGLIPKPLDATKRRRLCMSTPRLRVSFGRSAPQLVEDVSLL